MNFQFEVYPSGNVHWYINKVNSPSGVSAIIDRRMGVNENSLSGVAIYIKKIKDYINAGGNVGTKKYPIISGYFESLGYLSPRLDDNPFLISDDGVYSGVLDLFAKTTSINTNNAFIKTLICYSGIFKNTIFSKSTFADPKGSYLSDLSLVSSGNIYNHYSGYIKGYFPDESIIPISGSKSITSTPSTLNYRINHKYSKLNNIIIREDIFDKTQPSYGVISGSLVARDATITSPIYQSGNLYIDQSFIFNGSTPVAQQSISESVFNMNTHNHDGSASSRLSLTTLDSLTQPVDPFTINNTSGNIVVTRDYYGTSLGLYTSWEEVPMVNVSDAQKLCVYGDSLMVVEKDKAVDITLNSTPIKADPNCKIIGYSPVSSDNGMGDEFAIFHFDQYNTQNNDVSGHLTMKLYPSYKTYKTSLSFAGMAPRYYTLNGVYTKRIQNTFGNMIRYNSKSYLMIQEIVGVTSDQLFLNSLYEVDTINFSAKMIANHNGGTITNLTPPNWPSGVHDYHPATSFIPTNNTLITIAFYLGWDTYTVQRPMTLEYHPIYKTFYNDDKQDLVGTNINGPFSGFSIIPYSGSPISGIAAFTPVSGYAGNGRKIVTYTQHNGMTYALLDRTICTFQDTNMRTRFDKTNISGHMSIISYAGRLWTGRGLDIAYDDNGNKEVFPRLLNDLTTITGNADPWVHSPVVYDGYIYALAPKMSQKSWMSRRESFKSLINNDLPPGSKLVRRRASATELASYYN